MKNIDNLLINALNDIKKIKNEKSIDKFYSKYFGKKGVITFFLRNISSFSKRERPYFGKKINEIKLLIKSKLDRISEEIKKNKDNTFNNPFIDVTLPGRKTNIGHLHPITKIFMEATEIFKKLGFDFIEGPEVETEYYNFEALNLPNNHPAREMQDTFYISKDLLLRTHTTSTQPRVMEKKKPPIKNISFGKVYRCDFDSTHTPMFHQFEGLYVDKNVSFAHLKGLISIFVNKMFGNKAKMRFRPSFFPFTEPSAEVDISCVICNGTGCNVCSKTGWLEVIGAGMVHPSVFKNVGYKKGKYKGLAFGMGVERIAMIKYSINDIRRFFDNDFRFLEQF